MGRVTDAEPVTAIVEDLTHDGLGVADVDGRRAFVAGALPGETVRLIRRRRRRKLIDAELLEVVEASPDRVAPGCEYFGRCGGCALQHMSYPAQLRFKRKVVADAFASIAKLEPRSWLEPLTASQWGYRRRARLGIKLVPGKGRVLVGFRERAHPYITDMDHCPVLVPAVGQALADLASTVAGTSIADRIPQAEVSVGDTAGAIVIRVLEPPTAADERLLADFGSRHGLDVYVQPKGPDSVAPLAADPRPLEYRLERQGLTLEFEPNDFIQVNADVNAAMVDAALEAAAPLPEDRALDLYCGLGNLTLPLAGRVREVLGVEGDAALVARAMRNATRNGIANARFLTADLELGDWPFFRERWDLVVLDPARAGARAAVAAMGRMAPRRIVYVSCHPGTLARDAAVLTGEHGYELASVRVLDMFPNTHHVEAIATFDAGRGGARGG